MSDKVMKELRDELISIAKLTGATDFVWWATKRILEVKDDTAIPFAQMLSDLHWSYREEKKLEKEHKGV